MLKHKEYLDIERLKPHYVDGFVKGDEICIQEKIDGSNASFQYDESTDEIAAFSRRQVLGVSKTLNGFWGFTQSLDKELVKLVLGTKLRVFCEWLVPHSVRYPNERYKQAYCYDVYDTENEKFLPQSEVESIIKKLNLIYSPVLMSGTFESWEECMSFVGQTKLGGEFGEGIVIKNQTRLNDPNTRSPFYVKLVCEQFMEVHGRALKILSPEVIKQREAARALCQDIVTEARVVKILHKMVEDELIPEDWNSQDMATIAKNIVKLTYQDCIKEEADLVHRIEDFGKHTNSVCMGIVKRLLSEKNKVTEVI